MTQTTRTLARALLDVDALGAEGIEEVLEEAGQMRGEDGRPVRSRELAGQIVANLFYEASTRTRVSFEIAARNLGAEVVNVQPSGSSITKGESLVDTVRTLESLGADAIVIRHSEAGAPYLVSRHFDGAVVNAGDGLHAHPTQALLDLLTMRDRFGELRGLRVAIVGDVSHSRVARSTTIGLVLLGAHVRLCGPRTLLPPDGWLEYLPRSERGGGAVQTTSLAEALEGAQVVMALRMQRERQTGGLLPGLREFVRDYGLDREKLSRLAPGAVVMHPGPVNEGVELAPELIVAKDSLIGRQVANGVFVRMAVLRMLLGGERG